MGTGSLGLGGFAAAKRYVLLDKYRARFRGIFKVEAGAVTTSSRERLVADGLFQSWEYAGALINGS
ncbi:hypothetical protein [Streptomyces sp. NPDC094437]|uniref:hypothetical protein n=1 Tax=Streptomyces sp. NPDC094437 TaxID=3366060 RepID=UPI0037FD7596